MTKKTINVVVIEDNEYYNNLLSNAIHQSANLFLAKGTHKLVLRSFTNANEFIRKIKSKEIECDHTVVFVDYYLSDGINAGHVIDLLKEYSCDAMIVLLSQSRSVKEMTEPFKYDYFVVKDKYAPALCGLFLQQYIENKYSVSLDQ